MTVANVDDAIADPRTYADPSAYHRLFQTLRSDDPIRWTEPSACRPFWTVSKHADILDIEKQSDLFANAPRTLLRTRHEEEQVRKLTGSVQAVRTLVHMDEPDHRLYRQLTQAWFMPAKLRALEEGLAKLASEFVDRLAARGNECDFVRDIAMWFPLRVIMLILGVPPEDEALMLRLTQEHFGGADPNVNKDRERRNECGSRILRLFQEPDQRTAQVAEGRSSQPLGQCRDRRKTDQRFRPKFLLLPHSDGRA